MRFRVHLEPRDVKYIMQGGQAIMDRCLFCGRVGHIVEGLGISGRIKMIGKR